MKKLLLVVLAVLLILPSAAAEYLDTSRVQELLDIDLDSYKYARPAAILEDIKKLEGLMAECYDLRSNLGELYSMITGNYDYLLPPSSLEHLSRDELLAIRNMIDEQIAVLDAQAATAGEPDYSVLPLEDAFSAIGAASANTECTFRSYEYWETNHYVIHVDLDPATYATGLHNAIRYTIDFGRRAYPLTEVVTLRFVFHQPTINGKDGTPIIWKITENTFSQMNIDYIYDNTFACAAQFMDDCDSAAVFKSYKDAVR